MAEPYSVNDFLTKIKVTLFNSHVKYNIDGYVVLNLLACFLTYFKDQKKR